MYPWELPWITEYWDGANGVTPGDSANVAVWAPIVGTHSFTQGTDEDRLTYANGTLTADGVSQFMTTGAIAQNQPVTVFAVAARITQQAAAQSWFFDGATAGSGGLGTTQNQRNLFAYAGAAVSSGVTFTLEQFYLIGASFNGASSSVFVNLTQVTGNAGAGNPAGWTLAALGNGTEFGNVAFKAFGYGAGAWTLAEWTQLYYAAQRRYAFQ